MTTTMKKQTTTDMPKTGDVFQCDKCGMAIQVTKDCKCDDPDHVHFECCGQKMSKV